MVFYYYYRFELINERVHGKNCNNTIIDKKNTNSIRLATLLEWAHVMMSIINLIISSGGEIHREHNFNHNNFFN